MIDQGLIAFIKKKLEAAIPLDHIVISLKEAGFSESQIQEGIRCVHTQYRDTHQDIVASNNFLPPLKKDHLISKPTLIHAIEAHLFAGRLRRRDFIVGFLFMFGLGIVLVTLIANFLTIFFPQISETLRHIVTDSDSSAWLVLVPVLFAPITCMILSLAARRLHDIDLPGALSLVLLGYFVPPSDIIHEVSILGLYIMATLLFIIMITKRGVSHPNKYGNVRDFKGSLFDRMFNLR